MRGIVFIYLLIAPGLVLAQAKRAQTLIAKDKKEEAFQLLNKALVKDSLAPAEKYVLAKLYFNKNYSGINLDSAYHYILIAIESFGKIETKAQTKMANNGFDLNSFGQFKEEVEDAGFLRAKKGGHEQDYIDFLIQFSTSNYLDSAISLRNSTAFTTAENANTYQSYKQFFKTYPEALEVNKAKKSYEKLLFEYETADGKLLSYQQFLKNYPDTWHRDEVEQHIYNIITGRNSVDGYNQFLVQYPQSHLKDQAILSLYALLAEQQKEIFLTSGVLNKEHQDSIILVNALSSQLLFPAIHNKEYQLINSRGEVVLDHLSNISEADKCSNNVSDFVLVQIGDEKVLVTLAGSEIAKGDIVSVINQGRGILKINTSQNQYFINIAGFRSNMHAFKEASLIGPFIAYKENSKWGLESITGIPLIDSEYDQINSFHDHIILKRGKKWGIYPTSRFYPQLDGEVVETKLSYDQITVINEDYVWLGIGKKSSLMNRNGEIMVLMEEQSIELVKNGYFVDRIDSLQDSRISNSWYYDISLNENWIIGDKGEKKEIYYNNTLLFEADDAQIVGVSTAIITIADSTFCYFNDTSRVFMAEGDMIVPVHRMGQNSSVRHLIYTSAKKEKKVYNSKGTLVEVGVFDKLIDVGDEYILSRRKGSYNLLNDNGDIVLTDIRAASSLENGYISYLQAGKFGLFSARDSTLIEAKYDRPPTAYSDSLFVVMKDNNYGIINSNDSLLVPVKYSEIRYLNDTIAVLNRNFRWIFWDILNARLLVDNISDYWVYENEGQQVIKIFKGIGYGFWAADFGTILNSTYSEINILTKGGNTVYIAEKWVDEADLVIMLYYNKRGELLRKEVLSTAEYEDLICNTDQD